MILLFPLVLTLILITIVGVLLSPLLPLAYAVAATIGLLAFGRLLLSKVGFLNESGRLRPIRCLLGVLIPMLPWLLAGLLMGSTDGLARGFGVFCLVCAILITVVLGSMGVGAALLTRFGWRDYVASKSGQRRSRGAPTPAPPPIPQPSPFDEGQSSQPRVGETSRDSDRNSSQED